MPEHIPDWFKKFGYGEFIHLEHHKPCCARMIKGDKVFREVEQNCWDPQLRTKEMDMTEVGVQVLSTIPVLFNYWAKPEHGLETARFFNDVRSRSLAPFRPCAAHFRSTPTDILAVRRHVPKVPIAEVSISKFVIRYGPKLKLVSLSIRSGCFNPSLNILPCGP